MKTLMRKQLESRKAQAVRFTRDVRDDPDRAEEIAGWETRPFKGNEGDHLIPPGKKAALLYSN